MAGSWGSEDSEADAKEEFRLCNKRGDTGRWYRLELIANEIYQLQSLMAEG